MGSGSFQLTGNRSYACSSILLRRYHLKIYNEVTLSRNWYDASDQEVLVGGGLSGFIHCATTAQQRHGACIFSVDFGSAPVESLLELLAEFHS